MAQKAQNISKKDTFLLCLHNNMGHISNACKSANIPRRTFYNWLEKDNKFKEQVEDTAEALVDHVESKLLEKINKLDTTSIIFFLKCKGKDRGYTERTEIELSRPIEDIDFEDI
jgi:hypothetical protein